MGTKLKKLTSVCLAVIMILGVLTVAPITAGAAEENAESVSAPSGDYEYEVYDDTLFITGYSGSAVNLTIPSTLGGYAVEVIDGNAFEHCTSLKSVTFPESVTYIGNSAFNGCKNLVSVTIPDSVQGIGSYAFEATGLSKVTIPASVTEIGEYAFGYYFDDNEWDYVKKEGFTICGYANSKAEIYALEYGLSFENLGEVSPFLYELNDDDTAIITGYNGKETNLTIPSAINGYTVTEIGYNSFCDNTILKSVTIPDSVTYIGGAAFEDCTNLKSVTIPPTITGIGKGAFGYYFDDNVMNYVKKDDFTIYGYTNSRAELYANNNDFTFVSLGEVNPYLYELDYDDTLTIISYNGKETNLTIPSEIDGYTVTDIKYYAFLDNRNIKSVIIPNSITEIGSSAFNKCTNLESVSIPDSVKYIWNSAFEGCPSLKSITIPASVAYIGDYAFGYIYDDGASVKDDGFTIYGYTNSRAEVYANNNGFKFVSLGEVNPYLYDLNYHDTSTIISYSGKETNLNIPSEIDGYKVTAIDWRAFEDCTSLESVTIPDSVRWISYYAFCDCSNLNNVNIPASVTYIGEHALGYIYVKGVWEYVKVDNFTIYGYTGSDAERYANENGFKFVSLGVDPTQKLGDVNGDGSISIDDATAVQKYLANMLDLTDEQAELADVNTDGDITIDDVTLVQKYLAGLAEI